MENDTLYEADRLKITYLHSPEPGKESKVISAEDHELWMQIDGIWKKYILERGILEELAHTAKKGIFSRVSLMNKLHTINEDIIHRMFNEGIAPEDMGNAFIGAYQKEEDDFIKYLAEQRTQEI